MSPSTFGKRQREQDKKAKAEAKRQRRQSGGGDSDHTDAAESPAPRPDGPGGERDSGDDVLAMIADVHERYEAGTLSFEEFETAKAELLARIVVD